MKRYFAVFTVAAGFSLLAVFASVRCNNGSSNSGAVNTITSQLTPGTDTTIRLGQSTFFFPGNSITRNITCVTQILHDKSLLPGNFTAVTDIYSLTLSDPDVYDPENDGYVQFAVTDPLAYSVYGYYTKYKSQGNQWYRIGGVVTGNIIEVPIPQNSGLFVVGTENGDTELTAPDTQMRKGPFLMLTNDPTSMIVQWQVENGLSKHATLLWGPTYQSDPTKYPDQAQVTSDNNLFFSYQITGLTPAARTYYAVTITATGSGGPWVYQGSFLAPPPDSATSVTFYAYGDTRSYPVDHNRVLHYINVDAGSAADSRQTFMINAGDFCSRGLEEAKWDGEFFYYRKDNATNDAFATFPIMGAVGNHEYYYDKNGHCRYLPPAKLYKYYWNYPMYAADTRAAAAGHYSFDYGPVHIVSLDLYDEQFDPASEQYQWLINDLLGSSKPWKIVMFHHPAYCANKPGGGDGYGDTDSIRKYLSPLFEDPKYHVSLVIQGHLHSYARSVVNNLNYLTLGGGGAPLTDQDNANAPYVVMATKQYHFARLEAGVNDLKVTVFNANDTSYLQKIDYVDIPRPK